MPVAKAQATRAQVSVDWQRNLLQHTVVRAGDGEFERVGQRRQRARQRHHVVDALQGAITPPGLIRRDARLERRLQPDRLGVPQTHGQIGIGRDRADAPPVRDDPQTWLGTVGMTGFEQRGRNMRLGRIGRRERNGAGRRRLQRLRRVQQQQLDRVGAAVIGGALLQRERVKPGGCARAAVVAAAGVDIPDPPGIAHKRSQRGIVFRTARSN